MKRSAYLTLGVAAVAIMFATSASAQLTIDGDSAKCRAGFQKGMAKIVKSVQKGIGGCFKNDLKAGGNGAGCYVIGAYDAKGKLPGAKQKLVDSAAKCKNSAGYEADMVALYNGVCPSPAPGAVTDLPSLAACLGDLAEAQVVNTYRDLFRNTGAVVAGKTAQKCSGTLFKSVAKIVDGALKESAKCQATIEKGLAKATGPYPGYGCFGNYAKLSKSEAKLVDALPGGAKPKCSEQDLIDLGVAGGPAFGDNIGDSGAALALLTQNRVGHVRSLYEGLGQQGWEGGQCPVSAQVRLVGGFDGAGNRVAATNLDTGFKGVGHAFDLPGEFLGHVSLDCSGSADCSSCAIAVDPQFEGNRCSNDNTANCSDPFVTGGDCGAGNTCEVRFSAPLPLSSANTPVCVDNVIQSISGTANAGTGESNTTVNQRSIIYTGLSQTQPCTTCVGDPTANDGVRGGVCTGGGPDVGDPCDSNSVSDTFGFGETSYDCRPGGSNVSGAGLNITLTLDTGASTLSDTATTGDAACGPGSVLDCHCAVCSGDATVPCNTDADCIAVAAGVCDSDGTGAARFPNDCDGDAFACSDDGDGTGSCASKVSSFCDGALHASGRGYLACDTNADCDTLDPDCGGDCGDCTIVEPRACFLPDIEVSGNPSQQQTTVAGNFCIPGLGAAGASVNTAAGLAGPGRVAIDFEINAFCDSPGTVQFVGNGGNCAR